MSEPPYSRDKILKVLEVAGVRPITVAIEDRVLEAKLRLLFSEHPASAGIVASRKRDVIWLIDPHLQRFAIVLFDPSRPQYARNGGIGRADGAWVQGEISLVGDEIRLRDKNSSAIWNMLNGTLVPPASFNDLNQEIRGMLGARRDIGGTENVQIGPPTLSVGWAGYELKIHRMDRTGNLREALQRTFYELRLNEEETAILARVDGDRSPIVIPNFDPEEGPRISALREFEERLVGSFRPSPPLRPGPDYRNFPPR